MNIEEHINWINKWKHFSLTILSKESESESETNEFFSKKGTKNSSTEEMHLGPAIAQEKKRRNEKITEKILYTKEKESLESRREEEKGEDEWGRGTGPSGPARLKSAA